MEKNGIQLFKGWIVTKTSYRASNDGKDIYFSFHVLCRKKNDKTHQLRKIKINNPSDEARKYFKENIERGSYILIEGSVSEYLYLGKEYEQIDINSLKLLDEEKQKIINKIFF